MSEIASSGFGPGAKYATISKDFYKEILHDLDRVRTSMGIEDAKVNTEHLINKLKAKYEPKSNIADRLRQADAQKLQGSI